VLSLLRGRLDASAQTASELKEDSGLAIAEILSVHRIEPTKGYWRNQRRDAGRWPGSREIG